MTRKILIAPDSFKGTLSAAEVASAIARGLQLSFPGCETVEIPMADGGEGTVDAWVRAVGGGEFITADASDPLGRAIKCRYGSNGDTAVIELAEASGLTLLAKSERNPMITSTYGTGMLIRHALDSGVKNIILGIGGSATNDAGTGMLSALGARFTSRGSVLTPGGADLRKLVKIDISEMHPRMHSVRFQAACDVNNPLCGPDGASAVYGRQKGATPEMVAILDAALAHFADVAERFAFCDHSLRAAPGAGAAGGTGYALLAFCRAELKSGVRMIADSVKLKKRMKGCDLVITGEGCFDGQTMRGKVPAGVAEIARELGIPVAAICGCRGDGWQKAIDAGFTAVIPASPAGPPASHDEAMDAVTAAVDHLKYIANPFKPAAI